MLKIWIILGLVAAVAVQAYPNNGGELDVPVDGVPKEADLATIEGESEDYDEDDEDSGRALFSIIKTVVSQGIKHGAKHGAKVLGSAVMHGAKKVVKAGVMKTAKKLVWKGTKQVVKVAAEELAVAGIEAGVSALLPTGEEAAEDEEYEEVEEVDLFEFLADDELCECPNKMKCGCCADVPDFETACLNLTLVNGGSLWNENSEIRVSTFYGGEKALIHKFPVDSDLRKCRRLPESMEGVRLCISSLGRQEEGKSQAMCFMLEFDSHSLMKCIQQSKDGKLSMGLV